MLTATITGEACAIKAFQALKCVKLLFHFEARWTAGI